MAKPTLLYVYDALCGWCYGFSPVIRQLYERYGDQIDFTVLSGGMITGNRIGPLSQMRAYIQGAYKTVEERTGIRFGDGYLNGLLLKDDYISDSTRPGAAMTLFKAILPDRAIQFAADLQRAHHFDGMDLNVDANYGPLVESYGIDPEEFVAHIGDEAILQQTEQEFGLVASYGINGFPSVIVGNGDQLYLVARGYLPYEALEANVLRAINS